MTPEDRVEMVIAYAQNKLGIPRLFEANDLIKQTVSDSFTLLNNRVA